jgi:hypothetical protein
VSKPRRDDADVHSDLVQVRRSDMYGILVYTDVKERPPRMAWPFQT